MPSTQSRRAVLTLVGSGVVAIAGCTGTPGTPGSTETPVPTETPGTPTSPRWASVGLDATGTTCGGTPSVEFRETGETVRVVGVLVVSSLCFRASLRTATVEEGVARLVVVPVDVSDDETSCGQCIADASFEITGTFAGGLPDELVVELRGQEPGTYRTPL